MRDVPNMPRFGDALDALAPVVEIRPPGQAVRRIARRAGGAAGWAARLAVYAVVAAALVGGVYSFVRLVGPW